MSNLNIDPIVDVEVSLSAISTARIGFNLGLIIGPSAVIDAEERVRVFAGIDEMTEAGFTDEMPEYKAALLYFGQSPTPSRLAVGCIAEDETKLEAAQAARAKNSEWYGMCVLGAEKAEIQSIAAWANTQKVTFFFNTNDADVLTNAEDDIFSILKALGFKNTIGMYSADSYAAVSLMGYAMGANDGTENSAYTLAYKTLPGVMPDDLTQAQVDAVKGKNGNVYVTRNGTYNLFEQGVMSNGTPYDEVIGVDQLSYDIQIACMDILANTRSKVPHTDSGMLMFVSAINAELGNAVTRGFIAPGEWNGPKVLNLEPGDMLQTGYTVQFQPVAEQSRSDRAARKAPPIYICVKLAGAIEYVIIRINIDR